MQRFHMAQVMKTLIASSQINRRQFAAKKKKKTEQITRKMYFYRLIYNNFHLSPNL